MSSSKRKRKPRKVCRTVPTNDHAHSSIIEDEDDDDDAAEMRAYRRRRTLRIFPSSGESTPTNDRSRSPQSQQIVIEISSSDDDDDDNNMYGSARVDYVYHSFKKRKTGEREEIVKRMRTNDQNSAVSRLPSVEEVDEGPLRDIDTDRHFYSSKTTSIVPSGRTVRPTDALLSGNVTVPQRTVEQSMAFSPTIHLWKTATSNASKRRLVSQFVGAVSDTQALELGTVKEIDTVMEPATTDKVEPKTVVKVEPKTVVKVEPRRSSRKMQLQANEKVESGTANERVESGTVNEKVESGTALKSASGNVGSKPKKTTTNISRKRVSKLACGVPRPPMYVPSHTPRRPIAAAPSDSEPVLVNRITYTRVLRRDDHQVPFCYEAVRIDDKQYFTLWPNGRRDLPPWRKELVRVRCRYIKCHRPAAVSGGVQRVTGPRKPPIVMRYRRDLDKLSTVIVLQKPQKTSKSPHSTLYKFTHQEEQEKSLEAGKKQRTVNFEKGVDETDRKLMKAATKNPRWAQWKQIVDWIDPPELPRRPYPPPPSPAPKGRSNDQAIVPRNSYTPTTATTECNSGRTSGWTSKKNADKQQLQRYRPVVTTPPYDRPDTANKGGGGGDTSKGKWSQKEKLGITPIKGSIPPRDPLAIGRYKSPPLPERELHDDLLVHVTTPSKTDQSSEGFMTRRRVYFSPPTDERVYVPPSTHPPNMAKTDRWTYVRQAIEQQTKKIASHVTERKKSITPPTDTPPKRTPTNDLALPNRSDIVSQRTIHRATNHFKDTATQTSIVAVSVSIQTSDWPLQRSIGTQTTTDWPFVSLREMVNASSAREQWKVSSNNGKPLTTKKISDRKSKLIEHLQQRKAFRERVNTELRLLELPEQRKSSVRQEVLGGVVSPSLEGTNRLPLMKPSDEQEVVKRKGRSLLGK